MAIAEGVPKFWGAGGLTRGGGGARSGEKEEKWSGVGEPLVLVLVPVAVGVPVGGRGGVAVDSCW